LAAAYFTVHHTVYNVDVEAFSAAINLQTYLKSIQCSVRSQRTLYPTSINVTAILPNSITSGDKHTRMKSESQAVLAIYNFEFLFPVQLAHNLQNAYKNMQPYYGNLTTQLTQVIQRGSFESVFQHYCTVYNCTDMNDSPSFNKPMYFGPYLLDVGSYDYPTMQPVSNRVTSQDSSSTSISSSTLIVIVVGVIFLLLAIVSFYVFIKSLPKNRLPRRHNVGVPYEKVYYAPDQVEPVENPVSQRSILIDYNSSLEEYLQHTREQEILKYPSLVTGDGGDDGGVMNGENPMLVTRDSGRVVPSQQHATNNNPDELLSMVNPMLLASTSSSSNTSSSNNTQALEDPLISEETLRSIKIGYIYGSTVMDLNSSP